MLTIRTLTLLIAFVYLSECYKITYHVIHGQNEENQHENNENDNAALQKVLQKRSGLIDGHHETGGNNKEISDFNEKSGHKLDKGYKKKHYKDNSEHGKHGEIEKSKKYKKNGKNKKSNYDEDGYYSEQEESGKSHKAAKFGEKKGHKKGHKTKGYHNKFHRDEYHREHKFYDDYHKSGYYDKHGNVRSNYNKKSGGRKKGGSHKSGADGSHYGKDGHHDHGRIEKEDKGHNKKTGHESHRQRGEDHGNVKHSNDGKVFGYVIKL